MASASGDEPGVQVFKVHGGDQALQVAGGTGTNTLDLGAGGFMTKLFSRFDLLAKAAGLIHLNRLA